MVGIALVDQREQLLYVDDARAVDAEDGKLGDHAPGACGHVSAIALEAVPMDGWAPAA